jgi:acyl transferase domain-containing protein
MRALNPKSDAAVTFRGFGGTSATTIIREDANKRKEAQQSLNS